MSFQYYKINYVFPEEKRKNCCPSCDSSIVVQIEEEPLPSTSSTLKKCSETDQHNLIDTENSNDSTPINSRSGIIIVTKYLYTKWYNKINSNYYLRFRRT